MYKGKQIVGLGLMVVLLGMPAVMGLGVRAGQTEVEPTATGDSAVSNWSA